MKNAPASTETNATNANAPYVMYTTRVKDIIAKTNTYDHIALELRVDGTGYVFLKYAPGRYFERDFTVNDMKRSDVDLAAFIIACTNAYFTGWAVRTGLAVR